MEDENSCVDCNYGIGENVMSTKMVGLVIYKRRRKALFIILVYGAQGQWSYYFQHSPQQQYPCCRLVPPLGSVRTVFYYPKRFSMPFKGCSFQRLG